MKLIHYNKITERQYNDYIIEWESLGESIIPHTMIKISSDFEQIKARWRLQEIKPLAHQSYIRATLFFLVDESQRIIGVTQLRYNLTDKQIDSGISHIEAGIRPSERNKGYEAKMLELLLNTFYIRNADERLIMTVNDSNISSIRTLERNSAIFLSVFYEDEIKSRKYLILNK